MCGLIAVASPAAEHSKVPQSCPTLLRPPWTIAYQAPSSMGFSSQEYWSGLPLPSVLHGSGIAWFLIMCLALEWRELCLIQVGNKNVHDILDTNRCSMHIFCCCWVASVVSDSVWSHRWQSTGSSVPGILQARTLEWVSISFSNAWKWKVKVKLLSRVLLFRTPLTAAYQAPLSIGFSRQEYWNGVPLPSPEQ